jgi:nucleoside-diphosphate-sugar epimerase
MQVNTMGTFNVLEAAARAGVRRVVLAATDSALGFVFRRTDFDPAYVPIDEQHPLEPQDAYGLSKLVSEEICQAYHRAYGIETVRVRICRVIFPDEIDLNASLLADPSIMAKGLWVWIDARDAARAFRLAAERPGLADEAVFAVAPDVYARHTTADLIARFYPSWSLWADKLPGRASFISGARARDLLGFVPAHGVDD